MRITLSAILFFALLPALAAAQDPPSMQEPPVEPQIVQPAPAPAPPPTVVYYVPYFVPYAVFVPVPGVPHGDHGARRVPSGPLPNLPPPPAVGMLSGPPVSATGVFAGNPATGMFAGAPATGVFVAPPKAR